MATEHAHTWTRYMHLDRCHSYEDLLTCECGASRRIWAERDIAYDSYSVVWMADEGGEPCERCQALLNGAKPKHGDEIALPAGPEAEPAEGREG